MKRAPLGSLALFAVLLASCAGSHTPKPTGYFHNGWYWYEFPCSGWTEPARVVVNQSTGVADTTLALLRGRLVNNTGSTYTDAEPVLIIARRDTVPAHWQTAVSDKKGHYHFFLSPGVYRVEFMGFPSYWPLDVENVALRSGQRHRLDVFLRVAVSNAGSCVHKSRRPISRAKLDTLLARGQALQVRRYARGAKQRAAADARSATE